MRRYRRLFIPTGRSSLASAAARHEETFPLIDALVAKRLHIPASADVRDEFVRPIAALCALNNDMGALIANDSPTDEASFYYRQRRGRPAGSAPRARGGRQKSSASVTRH